MADLQTYTQAQLDAIVSRRLAEQEERSWHEVVDKVVRAVPAITDTLEGQGRLLAEIAREMEASRLLFRTNGYTPEEAESLHRQARLGASLHWLTGRVGKVLALVVTAAAVLSAIGSIYNAFFGVAHPVGH
jgi:hypothetical protein